MIIKRDMVDGNGRSVHVEVTIAEGGAALENAIQQLANKARATGRATALYGAVRVTVVEKPSADT